MNNVFEKLVTDKSLNNCVECKGCYSPYNVKDKENDSSQFWCELPAQDDNGNIKTPKGLCGFCNPKSLWHLAKE